MSEVFINILILAFFYNSKFISWSIKFSERSKININSLPSTKAYYVRKDAHILSFMIPIAFLQP